MKAIILAGGDLALRPAITSIIQDQEKVFIVAADGGLQHALTLGLSPDIIVGDFDSVSPEILEQFPDVPKKSYSRHKDLLDLEIALGVALEHGASSISILGGLGGRLDQSLAALFIATRFKREGIDISLHGYQDIYLLLAPESQRYELLIGQVFSLLSLSSHSVITLTNAAYPLNEFVLEYGVGLGISNEVRVTPLTLNIHEGLVVLILEYF
ncbi:MAG: thiamine diphosphokinase [Trueperaceae bacterium]